MQTYFPHFQRSKAIYLTGPGNTAIFIMVVSPAVLAHDVSGIAVLPIGWIYPGSFEKLRENEREGETNEANERDGETPQAREITC